ncbi:MAG: nitroreductase family protein [Acidimicrobiales bacterium]
MELQDAISGRHMVRTFSSRQVDPATVDRLCDLARRGPSAGNSQGLDLMVLDRRDTVARYWDATLAPHRRATFAWPGLVAAPVLVLVTVRPSSYVERYAEADKVAAGLGVDASAWPVPYWWVDAGAAAEHLLLGAVDAGLGACLFGAFEHEAKVTLEFGIPTDHRLVATIALGHLPSGTDANSKKGRSASRPRKPFAEVVHRNGW